MRAQFTTFSKCNCITHEPNDAFRAVVKWRLLISWCWRERDSMARRMCVVWWQGDVPINCSWKKINVYNFLYVSAQVGSWSTLLHRENIVTKHSGVSDDTVDRVQYLTRAINSKICVWDGWMWCMATDMAIDKPPVLTENWIIKNKVGLTGAN